ncbi:MAG: wax ester/triacylglycerol synthase domain-containing protein, partial [Casimicrobiaceae bacterium]
MAAKPKREKISAVDTAWLRMDRPQNLMMICGVLLFRRRLSLSRLRQVIAGRFLVFKRFKQRAVEAPGMAFWETDTHFDIRRHVVHAALPGRAGRKELQEFVSGLATTPLDPAHPMWQFHLVD